MRPIPCFAAAALALACQDDGPIHTGSPSSSEVAIALNEFMASNSTGLQDASGAYPDWIELYNDGPQDVDLGGYWITDDLTDRLEWQLPAGVVVPAGGYLVLFADSDTDEGDLHLPFNLDRLGEDIGLYGPSADNHVEIDAIADYGPQATDQSWARMPDGSGEWEPDPTPTPGAPNDGP